MIYLVYNLLCKYDVCDIVIFNGDSILFDYIILSNGKSVKHIQHVALSVLSDLKYTINEPIIMSGLGSDWVIVDIKIAIIHLMLLKSRASYNLDDFYFSNFKKIDIF